ncbi:MAG: plasmid pRiA4b ORF-3 family protein [Ardenticatenaceae bacterium]|nr:plasmid pRiA4b ORF-3 family protein [Ardenticatenaceae bacterium]HBY94591.1 hypothetical protein [Chloroflexota bacterium]
MKTYTFHVSLPGAGRVWRKIEMDADQTLQDLHFAIQRAYAWDADHLYSFFMSGKAWDSSSEYTLPEGASPWGDVVEVEEEKEEPDLSPEEREKALRELFGGGAGMTVEEMEAELTAFWEDVLAEEEAARSRDVRTTTIEELNLKPKQEFTYLFDYGDEWRFKVRVHAINENAEPTAEYPRVVESVGEAPEQYPDWE